MVMKEYNGFSGTERMMVQAIMNDLQNRGIISWSDKPCSICGSKGGEMQAHVEDYSNVFDYHPICIECHMKLHMRFRFPGYWIKHLIDVSNGYVSYPFKNSSEWFKSKKGKFSVPEFENINPSIIGNEWYHQLSMRQRNLNKFRQYGDHSKTTD